MYKVSIVRKGAKGPVPDTRTVITNHKSGADQNKLSPEKQLDEGVLRGKASDNAGVLFACQFGTKAQVVEVMKSSRWRLYSETQIQRVE